MDIAREEKALGIMAVCRRRGQEAVDKRPARSGPKSGHLWRVGESLPRVG